MSRGSLAARRVPVRVPKSLLLLGVVVAAVAQRPSRSPRNRDDHQTTPTPTPTTLLPRLRREIRDFGLNHDANAAENAGLGGVDAGRRHFPSSGHRRLGAVTAFLVASLATAAGGVIMERTATPSEHRLFASAASLASPRVARVEVLDEIWSDAPVAPATPPPTTAPAKTRPANDRLAAIAASAARASRGATRGPAVWPVNGPITGAFGEMRGHHRHPGIDISAPIGSPAAAAAPGTVVLAGPAPSAYAGYGNLVVIDHGDGDITLYAHLSRVMTHAGDVVSAGDVIGLVGATGRATGPHLHFEVRRGGSVIDPKAWVAARLGR